MEKPAKNDIIDFLCEEHGFHRTEFQKPVINKNLNSSQKALKTGSNKGETPDQILFWHNQQPVQPDYNNFSAFPFQNTPCPVL